MSREIRQELAACKRVYALAAKLAAPFRLPEWNIVTTMTDEEHDNLVKNTTTALTLKVEKLEAQLREANDALAAMAREAEQELRGDSEWVSVRSVV